jgi:two-component system, cell cycle response regulator DivK
MARILLVEDDEDSRDSLARRLRLKGFEVVESGDGAEGVALAAAQAPDLILLDMSLPGLTGWEACRAIRAAETGKRVPVIALTAHVTSGDRDEAYDAGCDLFEGKPVDFPKLLRQIETLLA